MEKYLSIRVQTALYISIFFIGMHHVFVYLTNSSTLKYIFNLNINEVLSVYGVASVFGLSVYLLLMKFGLRNNVKRNIYIATIIEIICLASMYYFTTNLNASLFVVFFLVHHLLTPYIMFNLDTLFESYTHIKDRGRGRGIYLTVWNTPFIIVPILMSVLNMNNLPIVYAISSLLLLPFLFLIFTYIKNPSYDEPDLAVNKGIRSTLFNFFSDTLDRKSFMSQTVLHFYYASTAILLPIYLRSVFLFDWDKIGLILAAMTAPFVLIQIPFGNMEDKMHNEKGIFRIGVVTAIFFTVCMLLIDPNLGQSTSFILLCATLFLANAGCSLIEISIESMFYKHVSDRDSNALLMFRMARILPYSLGILALFFI